MSRAGPPIVRVLLHDQSERDILQNVPTFRGRGPVPPLPAVHCPIHIRDGADRHVEGQMEMFIYGSDLQAERPGYRNAFSIKLLQQAAYIGCNV